MEYTLGALPSPPDPRDWPAMASFVQLPDTVRLQMPPIVSQGKVGNCVLQSIRMAAQMGVPIIIFTTPVSNYNLDKYNVWHNDGSILGYHEVFLGGYEPRQTANGKQGMGFVRNSWGDDWGDGGYCWMSWEDIFRQNDVWAVYPPDKGTGKFGVDFGYGRWRKHNTPGLYVREALGGYAKEGIVPLKDDPNNTEVEDVIYYAQYDHATRLLKLAAPYAGTTYYQLTSPADAMAVLYESSQIQRGFENPNIVVRHTSLRLKTPYMVDINTITGNDVTYCQQRLVAYGFEVVVDGIFGAKSEAAVIAFQTAKGLTADGIVGLETWRALETPTNLRDLRLHLPLMQGNDIMFAQTRLALLGYSVKPSGIYYPKTASLVRKLQQKKGLPITGIVDEATWKVLI